MSTTLKTLRREVWQYLNPEDDENLRASDVDQAINDVIKELCFDMNLLKDSAITTSISDQERYDLTSSTIWIPESATDSGGVINEGAEFSSSDTTLTVDDGTLFAVGQLIKIDSEYSRITAISTNDLTVVRGEAGSTAAAHDDGSTIYVGASLKLQRIRRVDYEGLRIDPMDIYDVTELDMT